MRQPFFIVGTGRVGSSLLYRLLASHPRVALTNEAHIADFLSFCARFASQPQGTPQDHSLLEDVRLHGIVGRAHADRFAEMFRERAIELLEDYYRKHFADRDFTHWGDKLPWASTAVEMQQVYPQARYVVLVRDPRDIVCSARAFRERDAAMAPLLRQQGDTDWADHWRNSYDALLRYIERRIVVRYEDLVRDPSAAVERVLDFLELDPAAGHGDAAALDAQFRGHGTSTDPAASVGRWQRELDGAQVRAIERLCAPLMRRFGYSPLTPPPATTGDGDAAAAGG